MFALLAGRLLLLLLAGRLLLLPAALLVLGVVLGVVLGSAVLGSAVLGPGHCYSFEEDAECADLYIKEIEGLQEQNDKMEMTMAELKEENKELTEKLERASGYCADFFDCMTDSQQQTLDQMSMQFWDGEPASHKDIVNYFRGLLKKADDLEEENDKLKEEIKELKGT